MTRDGDVAQDVIDDVIDELTADHRRLAELFAQLRATPPGTLERRWLADRLTIGLVTHEVVGRRTLTPLAELCPPDVAEQGVEPQEVFDGILRRIEDLPPYDLEFDPLVDRLESGFARHVEVEEGRLFPSIRETCPADALRDLGETARQTRRSAPTRAHPYASAGPGGKRCIAPGVGLVDRLHDALRVVG